MFRVSATVIYIILQQEFIFFIFNKKKVIEEKLSHKKNNSRVSITDYKQMFNFLRKTTQEVKFLFVLSMDSFLYYLQ